MSTQNVSTPFDIGFCESGEHFSEIESAATRPSSSRLEMLIRPRDPTPRRLSSSRAFYTESEDGAGLRTMRVMSSCWGLTVIRPPRVMVPAGDEVPQTQHTGPSP